MDSSDDKQFFSRREAAIYLNCSTSRLAYLACRGKGPPYVYAAGACIYQRQDLDNFAAENPLRKHSDLGGRKVPLRCYFRPNEKLLLSVAAHACGMSQSLFIREAVLAKLKGIKHLPGETKENSRL